MSNLKRAQRLRRAREKEDKARLRLENETPTYIHARIDLLFDAFSRMEEVLKQTNQSLKNTNIRMANLQVELQATQKQYTRVLLLLKEVVYDPQAIRFDEASVLDHIFTNGKTK